MSAEYETQRIGCSETLVPIMKKDVRCELRRSIIRRSYVRASGNVRCLTFNRIGSGLAIARAFQIVSHRLIQPLVSKSAWPADTVLFVQERRLSYQSRVTM